MAVYMDTGAPGPCTDKPSPRRWRVWRLAWFLILALTPVVPALGQARTGNIEGRVVDERGTPLPGVRVTLESDLFGARIQITDDNGDFRFLSVPPGDDYRVRFILPGFVPVEYPIRVRVGRSEVLKVTLRPGGRATIEVHGMPPELDLRHTEIQTSLYRGLLEGLPTARDPWAILELAPGVVVRETNVGGSRAGRQAYFYGRGESRKNAHWYLDGIMITDPVERGVSQKQYDFDTLEEVHVVTGAADVEVFTGGVTVNLVTRRGSNRFRGSARLYFADHRLQSENVTGVELAFPESRGNRIDRLADYGFNLGGPIIRDRFWFWAALGVLDNHVYVPTVRTDLREASRLHDINMKLNLALGPHLLEGQASLGVNRFDNQGASFTRPAPTAWRQKEWTPLWKFQDEWLVTKDLFLSIKLGTTRGYHVEQLPQGGRNVSAVLDLATGMWDRSYRWQIFDRDVSQLVVQAQWFRPGILGGESEFKVGAEVRYAGTTTETNWGNGRVIVYDDRTHPEMGGEVRYYRTGIMRPYVWRWTLYLQDRMIFRRWTLQLGLRYDRQHSGLRSTRVPANPWLPQWLPAGSSRDRRLPFTWHTWSPRIGATYDLTGHGTLLFKASTALYPATLDTHQATDLATTTLKELDFLWRTDRDGDGQPDEDEIDFSYPIFWDHEPGRPDRNVNAVEPGFGSPQNLEFMVGLEWAPNPRWAVAVNAFRRFLYHRKEAYPYDPQDPNGLDRFYTCWKEQGRVPQAWGGWPYYFCDLTKPPGIIWKNQAQYHRDYWGLELRFQHRVSGGGRLFGSFTWEHYTHHYTGRRAYLDPTNIEQLNHAHVDFGGANVRWIAKLGATLRLPGETWFGVTVIARDGFPFRSRFRVQRVSNGWGRNVDVLTHRVGDLRLPTFWVVNIRLDRAFPLQQWGEIQGILEVFNLFNRGIVLAQFDRADRPDLYGKATEVLAPRLVRLGIRYRF